MTYNAVAIFSDSNTASSDNNTASSSGRCGNFSWRGEG